MSQSKITLLGFHNWMQMHDRDLFEYLSLPNGIDKNVVVNNILMRGGEYEVLYSDPNFMQDLISTWSLKWRWTFDKWIKAINVEYSPLENYDRTETWTDSEDGTNTNSNTGTTTDHSEGNGDVENTVSAYDSSTYQPQDKSISNNETDSTTSVSANSSGSYEKASVHNARIHGNIGVTSSQQMLQQELDIAMFNLYDKIADIFLQEFVLPII